MATLYRGMAGTLVVVLGLAALSVSAAQVPFDGRQFRGRIAYSADGNYNDPDDWAASPVALAILARAGAGQHLVHFHYNSILPKTDPAWEREHASSVLGAARQFGFPPSIFFDCIRQLDQTIASLVHAVNESTAENPLYLILAGPVDVPFLALRQADPQRRRFVYVISHNRWNDGYADRSVSIWNKRDVIALGVRWVQITDQNPRLSTSRYSEEATPEHWRPWHWMRDSRDPAVRFLWERMQASGRPDCSDAGMVWFLISGDEEATPEKLRRLIDQRRVPQPVAARPTVRLEAENFFRLENFQVQPVRERQVSQRLGVVLSESRLGEIETEVFEPYLGGAGEFSLQVRAKGPAQGEARITLLRNGQPYGMPWRVSQRPQWWSLVIRGVPVAPGVRLGIRITTDRDEPVWLDYVQLERAGTRPQESSAAASGTATPPAIPTPTRLRDSGHSEQRASPARTVKLQFRNPFTRDVAPDSLDDPQALPGQIIVAGPQPGYLKYNGVAPAFLCGPDNPEEFFFLGELQPDGTRAGGPQEEIIDLLGRAGVNAFHVQMFRMRRCNIKDEGDDTHCPFVDHDPARPLNEKVLDQWDAWLAALEARGVTVHLEFYNDATDVERMGWKLDPDGNLHPHERRFIEGIVRRFQHRKNIIWGIQESCNKLPRSWVPHGRKIAELIAQTDRHHHPIVQSFVTPKTRERDMHPDGVTSKDYRADANIRLVTWLHIPPHGTDYQAQHQAYLQYALLDRDRFIVMKNETEYHRIDRTTARIHLWACAMTGMHTLEAQLNAARRDRHDRILDAGKLTAFMNHTDWHAMQPRDELAAGSTRWVLARPGQAYIAYTYQYEGPMGVRGIPQGTYHLMWFDPVDGDAVFQDNVVVENDPALWAKPPALGSEVALYITRAHRPGDQKAKDRSRPPD